MVDIVEEEFAVERFDDFADVLNVASVVIAVAGDGDGFSGKEVEVFEGVFEKVTVVGGVSVNEVAADDEHVWVLVFEPGKSSFG